MPIDPSDKAESTGPIEPTGPIGDRERTPYERTRFNIDARFGVEINRALARGDANALLPMIADWVMANDLIVSEDVVEEFARRCLNR